jgi:hypothetical protein
MPASTGTPIKRQVKKIHGLSVRYAESEPRDVSATLLSLIVGALTFFPAVSLGPIVEQLSHGRFF